MNDNKTEIVAANERSLSFQEAGIPELAEAAVKQAYYRALAAGCTVVEAVDGYLVEQWPDGSTQLIKQIPKALPVKPGTRRYRTRQ
jgi:hypothetical protein